MSLHVGNPQVNTVAGPALAERAGCLDEQGIITGERGTGANPQILPLGADEYTARGEELIAFPQQDRPSLLCRKADEAQMDQIKATYGRIKGLSHIHDTEGHAGQALFGRQITGITGHKLTDINAQDLLHGTVSGYREDPCARSTANIKNGLYTREIYLGGKKASNRANKLRLLRKPGHFCYILGIEKIAR